MMAILETVFWWSSGPDSLRLFLVVLQGSCVGKHDWRALLMEAFHVTTAMPPFSFFLHDVLMRFEMDVRPEGLRWFWYFRSLQGFCVVL